jgi:hypothetical protein
MDRLFIYANLKIGYRSRGEFCASSPIVCFVTRIIPHLRFFGSGASHSLYKKTVYTRYLRNIINSGG